MNFTREIHGHEVNPANEAITIRADERNPTNGNASHNYYISWASEVDKASRGVMIHFQDGPIKEVGINGITNEALLAILIDRMQGFQSSPYACRENALALTKLEEAKHWLEARTKERMARGVEGTHAK